MARMTAAKVPSGRSPWSRASMGRASGLRLQKRLAVIPWEPCGLLQPKRGVRAVFGAPGRTGPSHVVQFRAVGDERLGDELTPEGLEAGRDDLSVPAQRGLGEGGRTHRRHDA